MVGKVQSLWRYPVKGMQGEECEVLFFGYAGVYGDRLFAFSSSKNPKGFPFFTGRDHPPLILYQPRFRDEERAAEPVNFHEAEKLSPDINPLMASASQLMVEVEAPDGRTFAIDDRKLIEHLQAMAGGDHKLTLLSSDRAMTDCRPVSLISRKTMQRLGGESVEPERFRANIYLDLKSDKEFAEDAFIGRSLRIGETMTLQVLQRDIRCQMITLDPRTAKKDPALLKTVARANKGAAGVYAAVLNQGKVRRGDIVELLD